MEKECEFLLTAGMLDEYDKLRPYSILDLFQEMACRHADEIGVGYHKMLSDGYNWVITKNKFEIHKYPEASESVLVYTWPIAPGRADFDRAYLIKTLNGEILVEGKSKWCVIDSQTHKIIRSDKIKFNGEYINKESNIEFDRSTILKQNELDFLFDYVVTPSMLDHYHHMNNAKYAEVVYDALRLQSNEEIKTLQINNLKELKCGEIIKVFKTQINDTVYVYGYTEEQNEYNKLAFNSIIQLKKSLK